jgi:hypothetical protein
MAFPFFHRHHGVAHQEGDEPGTGGRRIGPGETLAAEAEAFLHGRLADRLVETGQPVPAWAMLNRLAHGTVEQLAGTMLDGGPQGWRAHPSLGGPQWFAAERALAARLIGDRTTAQSLHRIQTEVLVPLELSLITRSRIETITAGQVIAEAGRALDEHSLGR